jgi:beta-N-acetylhexosaminidase
MIGRRPRPWLLVAAVVAVLALVAGGVYAFVRRGDDDPTPRGAGASGPPSAAGVATQGAGSVAQPSPTANLTPQQRAGQRIIYSYAGLTPPPSLLQHIRNGEAAGVIFFSENVSGSEQIAGVVRQLRAAQQQSPVRLPLLLLTDQEGGQVKRLPGQPERSPKQIGQATDATAQATASGSAAAGTLGAAGLNVNLAPVLDVYYQAGNFIDDLGRSYSNNATTVGKLGAEFVKAQQKSGVAATAKHFPGLGSAATKENTDTGPVTVGVGLNGLRTRDELPYTEAIAAGVQLIMTSWAIYPALDPGRPAGLSATIVGKELRERLKFQGVTITDALEAGALKAFGTTAQRAVLAAQAGMDLILCSGRDVGQGESAAQGLVAGLAGGQLDPTAYQAALDRVTALRTGLR